MEPEARSPPTMSEQPPGVNLGRNAIVRLWSAATSPAKGRVSVHRQSVSGPLPWEVICPSKCPPDWEEISHRCEQFNGNPTVTSDPARTAVARNDPRHAPTSDCGIAPGAVAEVGDVGTAAVSAQLAASSAAIIGWMKGLVRTHSELQHEYRERLTTACLWQRYRRAMR